MPFRVHGKRDSDIRNRWITRREGQQESYTERKGRTEPLERKRIPDLKFEWEKDEL